MHTGNFVTKVGSGSSNVRNAGSLRVQWLRWRDLLLKVANVRLAKPKEVNIPHGIKCPSCRKPQRVTQTHSTTVCESQICTHCQIKYMTLFIAGFCDHCTNRVECLPLPLISFSGNLTVE